MSHQSCAAEDSGLYVVWLTMKTGHTVRVGALGHLFFPAGRYAYIGSAQKRRQARIARHGRIQKRKHWHLDYVRPYASITDISLHTGTREDECLLVKQLMHDTGARRLHKQFGASDCRCGGHLLHIK